MANRLLQAPTGAITRMLQSYIVVWLSEVGGARVSTGFNDTWTGERDNYSSATVRGTWVTICPLASSLTGDT
jgi:hypothetical protein